MSKVEKILMFLEKNNEIGKVNWNILMLFDNLLDENSFISSEYKLELKKLYIWFINSYNQELNNFEYNLNIHDLVIFIKKTRSYVDNEIKLNVIMKLKNENNQIIDLNQKVQYWIDFFNSNYQNSYQMQDNNYVNSNYQNNYQMQNNNYINSNYQNSEVIQNKITQEKNVLKKLKNLILWQGIITSLSLIWIFTILINFAILGFSYDGDNGSTIWVNIVAWMPYIIGFGTIINVSKTILGSLSLNNIDKIKYIKFNKNKLKIVSYLSILSFLTILVFVIIDILQIIEIIYTFISIKEINTSLKQNGKNI